MLLCIILASEVGPFLLTALCGLNNSSKLSEWLVKPNIKCEMKKNIYAVKFKEVISMRTGGWIG